MKKILFSLLSVTVSLGLWFAARMALDSSGSFSQASKLVAPKKEKLTKTEKKDILNYDPTAPVRWGLENTESSKAWRISKGSKKVVVAVIDTGADISHPSLKNNLWTNSGETGKDSKGRDKATNGVDDDNNGFVDDVHGWNFVNNTNSLQDNDRHGSHIAGIIGADGNNGPGLAGVAPQVSLMVLKYYDSKATVKNHLENTIKAIRYATKMGANIINYSGGGMSYSAEEFEAIRDARTNGILFVAAAGNERSNSDYFRYYPANYPLDNIISVTAINPSIKVLPSSNYGESTVHIAAPGEEIYSTVPGGGVGPMTGTSQATAFVTGVAVLVMANNSSLNYEEVKKHILATGDIEPSLAKKTGTSRRLNSYRALATIDQGLGLTGVKALNVRAEPGRQFSSERFSPTGADDAMSDISQSLLKRLQPQAIVPGT
jgi:thermitase